METEGFGNIKEELEVLSSDSAAAPKSGVFKFANNKNQRQQQFTLKPIPLV